MDGGGSSCGEDIPLKKQQDKQQTVAYGQMRFPPYGKTHF